MNRFYSLAISFLIFFSAQAQSKKNKNAQIQKPSLIAETTEYHGFFDFYYEESSDKIYLKVPQLDQ